MKRLATPLVFVLGAVALYALQRSMPTYADITRPIAARGSIGEIIAVRGFDLTVENLRVGRRLAYEAYGRTHILTTSGVWVAVQVTAEASAESVTISAATWRGENGVLFAASDRLGTYPRLLATMRLEPGLPRRAMLVFEIPENQLSGATLTVSRTPFTPLDSEVEIALPDLSGEGIATEINLGDRNG